MKRMSILFVIACLVLSGCADPLEQRSTQEVQGQFERGVTGQGTLGRWSDLRVIRPQSIASRRLIPSALKMSEKPTH